MHQEAIVTDAIEVNLMYKELPWEEYYSTVNAYDGHIDQAVICKAQRAQCEFCVLRFTKKLQPQAEIYYGDHLALANSPSDGQCLYCVKNTPYSTFHVDKCRHIILPLPW